MNKRSVTKIEHTEWVNSETGDEMYWTKGRSDYLEPDDEDIIVLKRVLGDGENSVTYWYRIK